ncbi:MAG: SDR family oxidoreductase [Dehalococcoidia bacterium]|nr:MAG: SDR family oxidoreductase [Dehalococcoidia bacterium]UCG82407.1 MAG: SDR family oxidoreductase [Dehalococcoidia bacterium]
MAIPDYSLTDKVAVVTGGSRGIGRSIALGFAEAGADVVIVSRTQADLETVLKELESKGRRGLAVPANVTVKAEVDNVVAKTLEVFNTIDILVNNAAMNIMRPLVDLREDGWDKVMNVCLKGYFLFSQAVAPVMMEKRKGNIINIASTGAAKAAVGLGAYGIAKAGVVMLTQLLAVELAQYNIRVNAIGPSLVRTKFSEPMWSNPDILKGLEATIPLGRIAEPEDIMSVALFLASDASCYVTGQTLYVDGGTLA